MPRSFHLTPQFINHRASIEQIAQKNNIKYLGLFGSYARGEQTPESDIDLLIDFKTTVDFFELYEVEQELADLLQKKIDLVTIKGLSKHIKPYIQDDLTTLYETT